MALLEVLRFPDERLRNKASPVTEIDDDIRKLSQDMLETMYEEGGIGLAATQVNRQDRVVIIDLSEEKNQPLVLINPEITAKEGHEEMREGCLSFPDYFDIVQRAEKIHYYYTDLENNKIEDQTDGLLAVCIQHEIDHLNGILFVDYLSPLKQKRLKKKLDKLDKLNSRIL